MSRRRGKARWCRVTTQTYLLNPCHCMCTCTSCSKYTKKNNKLTQNLDPFNIRTYTVFNTISNIIAHTPTYKKLAPLHQNVHSTFTHRKVVNVHFQRIADKKRIEGTKSQKLTNEAAHECYTNHTLLPRTQRAHHIHIYCDSPAFRLVFHSALPQEWQFQVAYTDGLLRFPEPFRHGTRTARLRPFPVSSWYSCSLLTSK